MRTPRVGNDENVNVQQTPSIIGTGPRYRGFITPGKSPGSNPATPHRAMPGRRDLGAGTLHFWNAHHTPGSGAGTDSVMTAADVRRSYRLPACAATAMLPRCWAPQKPALSAFTCMR